MLYFAYGSNMDPVQMAERCPGAEPVGAARLADHRLVFTLDSERWAGGVGHIAGAPGDEVWGVLWDVSERHLEKLDEYENVAGGWYRRDLVLVERDGERLDAVAYVADPRGDKPPSEAYVGALIRGATAFGLPERYVARLRAYLPS